LGALTDQTLLSSWSTETGGAATTEETEERAALVGREESERLDAGEARLLERAEEDDDEVEEEAAATRDERRTGSDSSHSYQCSSFFEDLAIVEYTSGEISQAVRAHWWPGFGSIPSSETDEQSVQRAGKDR
jgi:hypothetical protein